MAIPITTRRANGSPTACRIGRSGCSRSVPKAHADIMKTAMPDPSIRYSGQCRRSIGDISDVAAVAKPRDQTVDGNGAGAGDRQPGEDGDVSPLDEAEQRGQRIDVFPLG